MPVRLGRPNNVGGLAEVVGSPIFATGVGLIQYGYRYRQDKPMGKVEGSHLFSRIGQRMRNWFGDSA